jgi:endonuclease/exonuclease/phosphatase family metal-dependent hydrolase
MMLVVATHNLMNGLFLPAYFGYYRELMRSMGLDVLCVQESKHTLEGFGAARIARALGSEFTHKGDHSEYGVSIIYNRDKLRCTDLVLFPLPNPPRMSWLERRYIGDGRGEQMFALLAAFAPVRGDPFAVVNFHLDTVGGTPHRQNQVRAISEMLWSRGLARRVIACGDTNAFAFPRSKQLAALGQVLAPLHELGARDPGTRATHYFARQNEPKPAHRLCVLLGKLGIDVPGRYDVVCTNLPILRHGHRHTPESDHDLVWAQVAVTP